MLKLYGDNTSKRKANKAKAYPVNKMKKGNLRSCKKTLYAMLKSTTSNLSSVIDRAPNPISASPFCTNPMIPSHFPLLFLDPYSPLGEESISNSKFSFSARHSNNFLSTPSRTYTVTPKIEGTPTFKTRINV
ncbi:hypothetical protein TNCV_1479971 [Trichonephila clavipes]|nr:hypothetical protein TNCV_1479971 [Trichonephila clavipes]